MATRLSRKNNNMMMILNRFPIMIPELTIIRQLHLEWADFKNKIAFLLWVIKMSMCMHRPTLSTQIIILMLKLQTHILKTPIHILVQAAAWNIQIQTTHIRSQLCKIHIRLNQVKKFPHLTHMQFRDIQFRGGYMKNEKE